MSSPQILVPGAKGWSDPTRNRQWRAEWQQRRRQQLARQEVVRPYGKAHGTYVTDIAGAQQSVLLCRLCSHKFDPRPYHYYLTREFRVQGRCDGCREYEQEARFYIHESALGRRHGQCWTPR